MTLGQKIKEERLRKGLSQEDVAVAIGATKQAVYKYENQIVTNIPIDKIEKMAGLFEVTPEYLLGWGEKEGEAVESFSDEEVSVIHAYRRHPELQYTIRDMLGLQDSDKVYLFTAARSTDNKPPEITVMDKKMWEKLKSLPDTDEDLM